jgi:hypothetical protein
MSRNVISAQVRPTQEEEYQYLNPGKRVPPVPVLEASLITRVLEKKPTRRRLVSTPSTVRQPA